MKANLLIEDVTETDVLADDVSGAGVGQYMYLQVDGIVSREELIGEGEALRAVFSVSRVNDIKFGSGQGNLLGAVDVEFVLSNVVMPSHGKVEQNANPCPAIHPWDITPFRKHCVGKIRFTVVYQK